MTLGQWPPKSRARRIAYSLLKREEQLQSIARTAEKWGYHEVAVSLRKACSQGAPGYLWDAITQAEAQADDEEVAV